MYFNRKEWTFSISTDNDDEIAFQIPNYKAKHKKFIVSLKGIRSKHLTWSYYVYFYAVPDYTLKNSRIV